MAVGYHLCVAGVGIYGRIGRFTSLAGVLMAAVWCLAPVAAAAPPGSPCARNTVSALDQYCEQLPSAKGAQTPQAGTPALGPTLPPRVQRALAAPRGAIPQQVRQQLRLLPASATAPVPHPGTGVTPGAATATPPSPWSLSLPLILVLAAIALALLALAVARRRRRRQAS
jgi:hypothetical protein